MHGFPGYTNELQQALLLSGAFPINVLSVLSNIHHHWQPVKKKAENRQDKKVCAAFLDGHAQVMEETEFEEAMKKLSK